MSPRPGHSTEVVEHEDRVRDVVQPSERHRDVERSIDELRQAVHVTRDERGRDRQRFRHERRDEAGAFESGRIVVDAHDLPGSQASGLEENAPFAQNTSRTPGPGSEPLQPGQGHRASSRSRARAGPRVDVPGLRRSRTRTA